MVMKKELAAGVILLLCTSGATTRVTALGCSLPTASKPACDRWAYR